MYEVYTPSHHTISSIITILQNIVFYYMISILYYIIPYYINTILYYIISHYIIGPLPWTSTGPEARYFGGLRVQMLWNRQALVLEVLWMLRVLGRFPCIGALWTFTQSFQKDLTKRMKFLDDSKNPFLIEGLIRNQRLLEALAREGC